MVVIATKLHASLSQLGAPQLFRTITPSSTSHHGQWSGVMIAVAHSNWGAWFDGCSNLAYVKGPKHHFNTMVFSGLVVHQVQQPCIMCGLGLHQWKLIPVMDYATISLAYCRAGKLTCLHNGPSSLGIGSDGLNGCEFMSECFSLLIYHLGLVFLDFDKCLCKVHSFFASSQDVLKSMAMLLFIFCSLAF